MPPFQSTDITTLVDRNNTRVCYNISVFPINDVEPLTWLTDVLARILDHKANKLDELLPQNWISASNK
ncbi:transposase domain-containing protein [Puteibacter caeruleilacunae]|nr:transposase domain-containing protein [Puteibacter caeruleilacunae]